MQLSLGVSLSGGTTFENFYPGQANGLTVKALEHFSGGHGDSNLLLWGAPASGVSHLLQACCHNAHTHRLSARYVPLTELPASASTDVFESLDTFDVVCIDQLELICGKPEWEHAVFHLYNRLKDNNNRLLLATHSSPSELNVHLADLKSRILGCVVYNLQTLNDLEKAQCLQQRAQERGLHITDEVATFILNRTARSMHELFQLLDQLDLASLQQQRKLTVPFVKSVLGI